MMAQETLNVILASAQLVNTLLLYNTKLMTSKKLNY
jgi:hypothetical protein